MNNRREAASARHDLDLKTCCANVYQSDWARLLLGDSFHPGGTALTGHLGVLLHLGPGQRVLDVAAGPGTSAIHLARCFGCTVLGIEYSRVAVERANQAARSAGVAGLVTFEQGDAELLPVAASSFDAVVCECAFCTFPHKTAAASEFRRVLKPGGQVGLSDLTRRGEIPADLQGLLAWIACIADARPLEDYMRYLADTGLTVQLVERHDEALSNLVRDIQGKLLSAELLAKLNRLQLPEEIDLEQAKKMAKAAKAAIEAHEFGYAVVTASA